MVRNKRGLRHKPQGRNWGGMNDREILVAVGKDVEHLKKGVDDLSSVVYVDHGNRLRKLEIQDAKNSGAKGQNRDNRTVVIAIAAIIISIVAVVGNIIGG